MPLRPRRSPWLLSGPPGHPRLGRFFAALTVPFLLVGVGTTGYHLIERWPVFDALYMTVITITTVGFLEVRPLSPAGRAFTMFLSLGGIFTLFYAATEVIRAIVSGEVQALFGRQRMERALAEMEGHIVVCGYGRMGHLVCEEFSTLRLPYVIIDRDADLLAGFAAPFGIALVGDATSDEVLRQAGIARARALVTVAASDADNLYITMSARLLNEKLLIVARAEEEEAERKLKRAGADRVVSPYVIGGQRVAQAVLRPAVLDFLELATHSGFPELQIEETVVGAGSTLAGRALKDSRLREDLGLIIVAIRRQDGAMVFNPSADTVLAAGDLLITLGPTEKLERLQSLAGRSGPAARS